MAVTRRTGVLHFGENGSLAASSYFRTFTSADNARRLLGLLG